MWIASRLTFSLRKIGMPYFVQVLDYSIFKCGPLFKIGNLVPFLLRKIDNLGTVHVFFMKRSSNPQCQSPVGKLP